MDRRRILALNLIGLAAIMPPHGVYVLQTIFGIGLFGGLAYAMLALFAPKKTALLTARHLGTIWRWLKGY